MYMLSTLLAPYIVPSWVPHRVTLILSLVMLGLSILFVAPFFAEKNLVSMLVGLAFSGFFSGFLVIPNFPEMVAGFEEAFPKCDKDLASGLLSGMYNGLYALG